MFRIFMDVCCLSNYSESFPGTGEQMERTIETLVFPPLLKLFASAQIEDTRVFCQPATATQPALCSFQLWASCPVEEVDQSVEVLEAGLEDGISCVLLQHFSQVMVSAVSVSRLPDTRLDITAFLRSA